MFETIRRYKTQVLAISAGIILLVVLILLWNLGGGPGLVNYTSVDQVFSEPILRRFEKETGVRVRTVFDTEETKSTGVLNRLIAEADSPQAAVFWSGDPVRPFLLIQRGLVEPYVSPSAGTIPQGFKDAAGAKHQAQARQAPVATQPAATQATLAAGHEIRIPGTLIADQAVELYAKASGYVSELNVDYGSSVRKGDVLVRLSVPELVDELRSAEALLAVNRAKIRALEAKVREATAAINTAKAEVTRATAEHGLRQITTGRKKQLRQENAIPQQEFDEADSQLQVAAAIVETAKEKVASADAQRASAEAEVSVAEAESVVADANVARLKTLIGYETIIAPFDGIVTERMVDIGAFVRSAAAGTTTPVLSIAAVDRIRLVVEVPEFEVPRIHIGTPAEVVILPVGDCPLHATVSRTAGVLRTRTRAMRIEIDLDNRDGRLVAGMYAQVTFKP